MRVLALIAMYSAISDAASLRRAPKDDVTDLSLRDSKPLQRRTIEKTSISTLPPSDVASDGLSGDGIQCSLVTFGKDQSFEVCYKAEMQAVSGIGFFENGTETPAALHYWYNYTILGEYDDISVTMEREGYVVSTTDGQIDQTQCNFVKINGMMCNSCQYCGNETYSVDCTNIPFGRMTTCESSMPVFFPLVKDSLKQKPLRDSTIPPSDLASEMPSDASSDLGSDLSSDPFASMPPSDSSSDSSTLQCSIVTYGKNHSFEVCYKAELQAISGIGLYENGTETPASQDYWYTYTILGSHPITVAMERSGDVVYTPKGQIDKTQCNYVEIDGTMCNSCHYCGNEMFSADCTNIPYGRNTTCEPSMPVYFPLTEESLK